MIVLQMLLSTEKPDTTGSVGRSVMPSKLFEILLPGDTLA